MTSRRMQAFYVKKLPRLRNKIKLTPLLTSLWGYGESPGPYPGWRVTEERYCCPEQALGYSPGVVDANKHSLSTSKTVCAW